MVLDIGREKSKEFLLKYTDNEKEAEAVKGMVDDTFNIVSIARSTKNTLSSVKSARKSLKTLTSKSNPSKSKSLKLSYANSNTKPSLKNNSETSSFINDNSKRTKRTHYKAINDNGEKGNLIFLNNLPESTSKVKSMDSFLKESLSLKPINNNNNPIL